MDHPAPSCPARTRYTLSFMASIGFGIAYAMRAGPSVAILSIGKEFMYSGHEKGLFLGAFYYG